MPLAQPTRFPALWMRVFLGAATFELFIINQQIDAAARNIDLDLVTLLDQRDPATGSGFGRYVTD